MRIFIILLSVLAINCTPEKRIARILKNNPHLIKKDSVIVRDTIVTQGVSKDSTFYFFQSDTVKIVKENMVLKYYYNTSDSTVYISGECKGDTIYREYVREVNSVSVQESKGIIQNLKDSIYNPLIWLLLILIGLFYFKK